MGHMDNFASDIRNQLLDLLGRDCLASVTFTNLDVAWLYLTVKCVPTRISTNYPSAFWAALQHRKRSCPTSPSTFSISRISYDLLNVKIQWVCKQWNDIIFQSDSSASNTSVNSHAAAIGRHFSSHDTPLL